MLFNVSYANQILNKNKPCNTATFLWKALNSLYCGAIFFMEPEIWKDVIGYVGLYQISSFGNVKRLGGFVVGKKHGWHRRWVQARNPRAPGSR